MIHNMKSNPSYSTGFGSSFCGDSLSLMSEMVEESIDLVFTSPPFALLSPKEYGNEDQSSYTEWISRFASEVKRILKPTGSFVLDFGGSYERGYPVRSLYHFRVLIHLCDIVGFHLAQEFYWFNPAKLPAPVQWTCKQKIRAKDSVNTLWWLSKTPYPKADTTKVLTQYSKRMENLIKKPNACGLTKCRPSGHAVKESFAKDNGGALPSNLLSISNTESNSGYLKLCRAHNRKPHPARFPSKLPEFFIKFLTDPGDTVLDIFAGSNTTGAVAEALGRKWIAFEKNQDYVETSKFRFDDGNAARNSAQKTSGASQTTQATPSSSLPCDV